MKIPLMLLLLGAGLAAPGRAADEGSPEQNLAALGLTEDAIAPVAAAAASASSTKGNPVAVTADDLAGILRRSL